MIKTMKQSGVLALLVLSISLAGCSSNEEETAATSSAATSAQAPAQVKKPFFSAEGRDLLDPDGQVFIARGINLQFGDKPDVRLAGIKAIAETGANIVRLQLRKNTTADQLQAALDIAFKHDLVVMPVLWEEEGQITCTESDQYLKQYTKSLWLDRWLPVLSKPKYQYNLLINIANEWGPKDVWSARDSEAYENWVSSYEGLIADFRAARIFAPLVIDAPGCGQDYNAFLGGRARRLFRADPYGNVVLSVHAYHSHWASERAVAKALTAIRSTGMPFIVGEFGGSGFQGKHSIDHNSLMALASGQNGRDPWGWIAWSWKGNDTESLMLDMSKSEDKVELNARGEEIVNGEFGIKKTAKPAHL